MCTTVIHNTAEISFTFSSKQSSLLTCCLLEERVVTCNIKNTLIIVTHRKTPKLTRQLKSKLTTAFRLWPTAVFPPGLIGVLKLSSLGDTSVLTVVQCTKQVYITMTTQ